MQGQDQQHHSPKSPAATDEDDEYVEGLDRPGTKKPRKVTGDELPGSRGGVGGEGGVERACRNVHPAVPGGPQAAAVLLHYPPHACASPRRRQEKN